MSPVIYCAESGEWNGCMGLLLPHHEGEGPQVKLSLSLGPSTQGKAEV